MLRQLWKNFSQNLRENVAVWGVLPGTFAITLVMVARSMGMLEVLELKAFDLFLRLRPAEPTDERILLVGIDEDDIADIDTYPIPDANLTQLIETLQTFQPAVIGLNISRELPVEPGRDRLLAAFARYENSIAVEKVLPTIILPPPGLSSEQLSFNDLPLDGDFHRRRQFLGMPTQMPANIGYKFSFSLRLAEMYLAREGIELENGLRDPHAMRFGEVELPRLYPNSGSYVGLDAGGVQVLLNFRSGSGPFRTVSMRDIETGQVDSEWIRDRIVIIGITDPDFQRFVFTSAVANPSGEIAESEFQAHGVSQILSAVLDDRVLLQVGWEGWEYLWIIGWGLGGIAIGYRTRSLWQNVFVIGIISAVLIATSYFVIFWGWWIPLIPALLTLLFGNFGYTTFSEYDRHLRARIHERQRTIEQTFNIIHNGPLQTLATILRRTRDGNLLPEQFFSELENLNTEIRAVGDRLEQEVSTQDRYFHLGGQLRFDLKQPIDEIFYEVYSNTLDRDLTYFEFIKLMEVKFAPINEGYLSLEQKRQLCYFLEEALCNVGKHAVGVTELSVTGTHDRNSGRYSLTITDNGRGKPSKLKGRGTKHCFKIEKNFTGGTYQSMFLIPHGFQCQFSWVL